MVELGLRFKSKTVYIILLWLVVQQVIVASSSYWLVKFTAGLEQGSLQWAWLGFYLLSLLLPYLPGAAALYAVKMLELESLNQFWNCIYERLLSRIDLYSNRDVKSSTLAVLVKDGPQLITDITHFGYDLVSTSLNAVLNVVIIGLLLSPIFLGSYLVSLLLAAVLIRTFSQKNGELASQAEIKKIELNRLLNRLWDNVTINNKSSRELWDAAFDGAYGESRTSALMSEYYRQVSSIGLTLATFGPTLIAIFVFSYRHQQNFGELVALGVLLPRMFMILNHTSAIIYLVRDMALYRGRLSQITNALKLPLHTELCKRVDFDKINIKTSLGQLVKVDNLSELPSSGWLTVRGSNGAGKSSLLCHLKHRLGEEAFYYPPHSELNFANRLDATSTGQKTISEIKTVLKNEKAPILLLDEWDANLDNNWRAQIEEEIRQASGNRLIIDVRHRA